jgi:hypothetical protein
VIDFSSLVAAIASKLRDLAFPLLISSGVIIFFSDEVVELIGTQEIPFSWLTAALIIFLLSAGQIIQRFYFSARESFANWQKSSNYGVQQNAA